MIKKILVFFLLVSLFGFYFLFPGKSLAITWDDCPKGKIDDQYPGDCNLYVDTDKDGVCDHSQPAPEDRDAGKQITSEEESVSIGGSNTTSRPKKINYFFIPITILISAGYLLTKKQKKMWNLILAIVFVANTLTNILLIAQLTFGLNFGLPFNLNFWHIETGFILMVIAAIHFFWHLSYYQQFVKKL